METEKTFSEEWDEMTRQCDADFEKYLKGLDTEWLTDMEISIMRSSFKVGWHKRGVLEAEKKLAEKLGTLHEVH